MRITHVTKVEYVGDYRLALEFDDGTSGVADLEQDLGQRSLSKLRDKEVFSKAFIDGGTVCWPGNLDLAAEWLYARAHGLPAPRTGEQVEANQAEMSLRMLRKELGVTQADLAAAVEMTQSDVSKLEKRTDYRVSMLRRVVEGLGGHLEVVAVVGEKRVKLAV